MVKIRGLNRHMRAVLFNIQIRELDVGKLSIDWGKWVLWEEDRLMLRKLQWNWS